MKLRIQGDSIRLRLTQIEVAAIGRGELVAETTCLPTPFVYVLDVGGDKVSALYSKDSLCVTLPENIALRWATTNEISIRGCEGKVDILVEKDFECLDPRPGERDADVFPNPKAKRKLG